MALFDDENIPSGPTEVHPRGWYEFEIVKVKEWEANEYGPRSLEVVFRSSVGRVRDRMQLDKSENPDKDYRWRRVAMFKAIGERLGYTYEELKQQLELVGFDWLVGRKVWLLIEHTILKSGKNKGNTIAAVRGQSSEMPQDAVKVPEDDALPF